MVTTLFKCRYPVKVATEDIFEDYDDIGRRTGHYRRESSFSYFPCGHCPFCLRSKYFEWTVRCMHELMSYNNKATFFTLTYKSSELPMNDDTKPEVPGDACGTINHEHTTLFWKRLRRHFDKVDGRRLKYIGCSEYGPVTMRPHYHFLVYGIDHSELIPVVEKLWNRGRVHVSTRPVTVHAIQYVLGYVRKKNSF